MSKAQLVLCLVAGFTIAALGATYKELAYAMGGQVIGIILMAMQHNEEG